MRLSGGICLATSTCICFPSTAPPGNRLRIVISQTDSDNSGWSTGNACFSTATTGRCAVACFLSVLVSRMCLFLRHLASSSGSPCALLRAGQRMRDSDFGASWLRSPFHEQGARLRVDGETVFQRSAAQWRHEEPMDEGSLLWSQKLRVYQRFRSSNQRTRGLAMVARCDDQIRPQGGVEVSRFEQASANCRNGSKR